jgi:hypothetical protein
LPVLRNSGGGSCRNNRGRNRHRKNGKKGGLHETGGVKEEFAMSGDKTYQCPNCGEYHTFNWADVMRTHINGVEVEGFCSTRCKEAYQDKHDKASRSGAYGRKVSVIRILGLDKALKGVEDNIRHLGGGLFIDIAKLLFRPVRWLLGLILGLVWKLVSALAKLARRGIGKGFLALKSAAAARRERKRAAIPGGGAPGEGGA